MAFEATERAGAMTGGTPGGVLPVAVFASGGGGIRRQSRRRPSVSESRSTRRRRPDAQYGIPEAVNNPADSEYPGQISLTTSEREIQEINA